MQQTRTQAQPVLSALKLPRARRGGGEIFEGASAAALAQRPLQYFAMWDGLVGLGLWGVGALWVRRFAWSWGVVGVWLNLLWFIYQNELGQGWLFYLRGVGLAFVLAAGYRQYGLAWALLPWPLFLVGRFEVQMLWPYFPAWGEGLMLGAVFYLLVGLFKRP